MQPTGAGAGILGGLRVEGCFSVEIGEQGVSFKTSLRVGGGSNGGQRMEDLQQKLEVVRLEGEVVAAVGVSYDQHTGVADIGPLAVSVGRQVGLLPPPALC